MSNLKQIKNEYLTATISLLGAELKSLKEYGCCDGNVSFKKCPCEKEEYISVSSKCTFETKTYSYNDEKGNACVVVENTCTKCGLVTKTIDKFVADGTTIKAVREYVVMKGDQVILTKNYDE